MERSLTSNAVEFVAETLNIGRKQGMVPNELNAHNITKVWRAKVSVEEMAQPSALSSIIEAFEEHCWRINCAYPSEKWIRSTSRKFERLRPKVGFYYLGSIFVTQKHSRESAANQIIHHFFVEVVSSEPVDSPPDEGGTQDDKIAT